MFRHLALLVFSLFTLSFVIHAQDEQAIAHEIILKTVAKYKAQTSSFIQFNYIMENRMDNSKDEQKGSIYLKNGNFHLNIDQQTIISNQVKVWTYMKEVNEVQVSKYNPEELEINPNEIFTMWDEGFLSRHTGTIYINNIAVNVIELTPTNKDLSYFKVKLFIDKKTNDIKRIQTFYKNSGIILTFEILSVKPNIQISDKMFQFETSKYPGIEVVDLTK
jgi:outer membrane lipoprotein carrier protein